MMPIATYFSLIKILVNCLLNKGIVRTTSFIHQIFYNFKLNFRNAKIEFPSFV